MTSASCRNADPCCFRIRAAIKYVARDFPAAAKLHHENVYETSLVQSALARLGR